MTEPTLCLCLIIRNEASIITRLFENVCKYLDYWCIVDTGSTDGTQDIIKNFFKDKNIPGELHEQPFVNFGYNRSQLMLKAYDKADWLLLADADFTYNFTRENFKLLLGENTEMSHGVIYTNNIRKINAYMLPYDEPDRFYQMLLVSGRIPWYYVGLTHEYIMTEEKIQSCKFEWIEIVHKQDGVSRKEKFERDIKFLKQSLEDDPSNTRTIYYLANTYFGCNKLDEAIDTFSKRVIMAGEDDEEAYLSKYRYCLSRLQRGDDFRDVLGHFLEAFRLRPTRLEALYDLVLYCKLQEDFNMAYLFGRMYKISADWKKDIIHLKQILYTHVFLIEMAEISLKVGDASYAQTCYQYLLRSPDTPMEVKNGILLNLSNN